MSEKQAKALLKAVKKSEYCDSLLSSQERSINILLDESNATREALNAKKQAFKECSLSLDAYKQKEVTYTNIIEQDKKLISWLKKQKWLFLAGGVAAGFVLGR